MLKIFLFQIIILNFQIIWESWKQKNTYKYSAAQLFTTLINISL